MLTVFISYSHDDDAHQQRVYALADRLIKDGVKVILDRDCGPGGPDEGWDKWSETQADKSDLVLPVFTPSYRKCWDGQQMPGMRLGAIHEQKVIYRRLYDAGSDIEFARILTFDADHRGSIPTFLKGLPAFDATTDYPNLIGWLREKGAAPELDDSPNQITWPKIPADYRWPLADRVDQFETFKTILGGQAAQRIFLVEGASNTGKTVLLNELFRLAQQVNLNAVQLDLKGCPGLEELLENLRLDSTADLLPEFHKAAGSNRKSALLQDLNKLKQPFLLGLDTYQQISPDIADWLESQLLRRVEKCPALLVLIAGQRVPDRNKNAWKDCANHVCLQPIKEKNYWRDYAHQVLNSSHITDQHIEMLLHVSQGDPGQTSALLQSFAVGQQQG